MRERLLPDDGNAGKYNRRARISPVSLTGRRAGNDTSGVVLPW